MPQLSLPSPIGDLTISEEDGRIVSIDWGRIPAALRMETPLLCRARLQLEEYFEGRRRRFDLPLAPVGTVYQRRVWEALNAIPYGTVKRYGELAAALKSAARAIGGACGANPIPIIIPCHRVLSAGKGMGGYSGDGGLDIKRYLLTLEGWSPGGN